jgi:hypothetical protein
MAWVVASFFFMEMIRLIDTLFSPCFADRLGNYCAVVFIILAERKGKETF